MKRAKLVAYISARGCYLIREGGRHSIYYSPIAGRTSAVPRHAEIPDPLAGKICKDLGLPKIRKGK